MSVTSEVGLSTNRDLAELSVLKKTQRLLFLRDTGSHVVRTTMQQIVKNVHLSSCLICNTVFCPFLATIRLSIASRISDNPFWFVGWFNPFAWGYRKYIRGVTIALFIFSL